MTDQQLWQKILAGDQKSWADLIKRYQSLVYAVASRAGLSMADISDCFQQTWVSLYNHRKKVKDPSKLSAWLVTTAKREALRLNEIASKKVNDNLDCQEPDVQLLPDEELEQLEKQAHLEIAIDLLDKRCQDLVEIFFFAPKDLSYKQIAANLGIPFNSLGPIRRRCLERLRKILVKNGFGGIRNDDSDPL